MQDTPHPGPLVVDVRSVAADHPFALELAHPVVDRGRREPDPVADPAPALQDGSAALESLATRAEDGPDSVLESGLGHSESELRRHLGRQLKRLSAEADDVRLGLHLRPVREVLLEGLLPTARPPPVRNRAHTGPTVAVGQCSIPRAHGGPEAGRQLSRTAAQIADSIDFVGGILGAVCGQRVGKPRAMRPWHGGRTGVALEALRANPSGVRVPLQTRYRKFAEQKDGAPQGFATPTRKIELYSETLLAM